MAKKNAPVVSAAQLAELSARAKKIDAEHGDEIRALAKTVLARHEQARRAKIAQAVARLKAQRLARGLTLDEVGAASGVGKSNLSRLENDASPNPTIDTLLRVSEAVGIELLAL